MLKRSCFEVILDWVKKGYMTGGYPLIFNRKKAIAHRKWHKIYELML
jgi:hypothetical protein